MPAGDRLTEARRWVKFPATLLFATGVLWLLQSIFLFDRAHVLQQIETFLGSARVAADFVIIPLGSVAVGMGMLFLQRWALAAGLVLPCLPLLLLSYDKILRIAGKFSESHSTGDFASLGAGVMTSLLVLALWAAYGLSIWYIRKSWRLLAGLQEWVRAPSRRGAGSAQQEHGEQPGEMEEGDLCLLMPEGAGEEPA
jgi:hypothetical protein